MITIGASRLATGETTSDDVVITIDGERISRVEPRPAGQAVDHDHHGWVVPGFVDTHTHGGGGADLGDLDPERVMEAVGFHRRHGTTTSFASLVTAPPEQIIAQLAVLAPLVSSGELAGVHLEGPFLSPAKRGAHKPSLLITPTPELIDRLLEAGRGAVSMITIAPELPGGLAAIEQITAAGVTAAVGHTDADRDVIMAALDAGARVATHLFNAMPPIHHREPGPVPRLLDDPRCLVEVICDGTHLHPDVIAMAMDAAGPDRTALITDAMIAAGMSDGTYRLGELDVAVIDGVAKLREEDGSLGSIAGSTLTMARAFAFVVQQVGRSLPEVARMAATTPARWHGLDDVGVIAPGRRADLVLTDERGSLVRVMRAGQWIDEAGIDEAGIDEAGIDEAGIDEAGIDEEATP